MITSESLNTILNRNKIKKEVENILSLFENDANNVMKKGIFIQGPPGCGKTHFIKNILKNLGYDTVLYDAGDVRNKSLFQNIDSNHVSNRNVLDLMKKKPRKIAIIMDEIDGMNNGDKGGIDSLIKLIRQKKTKKQKTENTTSNPIICIGSNENDKKIRELMKVCHLFELHSPNNNEMTNLFKLYLPPFSEWDKNFIKCVLNYVQGDLRKMIFLKSLWEKTPHLLNKENLTNIFHIKIYNEDSKKITSKLFENNVHIEDHNIFMNETDRTTVALLWHENLARILCNYNSNEIIPFYCDILNNICFADYIGRITFQSQIWQFNEMTSLIKTFYNNKLYHNFIENKQKYTLDKIEFTKVLTKYSTEYNNQMFLQNMCQKMNMDKKDVISFYNEVRDLLLSKNETINFFEDLLCKYDIDVLDIKRIYRFIDKHKVDEVNVDIEVCED